MSEFAGSLSQRMEVWRRTDDHQPGGVVDEVWSLIDRLLAKVDAEGAGSVTEGMTFSSLPKYRVTIRKGPALAIDDQLRWRGTRLAIRQIVDDPAKADRVTVRCEELR